MTCLSATSKSSSHGVDAGECVERHEGKRKKQPSPGKLRPQYATNATHLFVSLIVLFNGVLGLKVRCAHGHMGLFVPGHTLLVSGSQSACAAASMAKMAVLRLVLAPPVCFARASCNLPSLRLAAEKKYYPIGLPLTMLVVRHVSLPLNTVALGYNQVMYLSMPKSWIVPGPR